MHELTLRERATVIAALRAWAAAGAPKGAPESDIATDAGAIEPLTVKECHELADRFNSADEGGYPTIVVQCDGAAIHAVAASQPARIIFLDDDTEGGDDENIATVDGREVYVMDYLEITPDDNGDPNCGVSPQFVAEIAREVDDHYVRG